MSVTSEKDEETINGVPHRLLDDYDADAKVPDSIVSELLKNAPPEFKARAEQFAKEREAVLLAEELMKKES